MAFRSWLESLRGRRSGCAHRGIRSEHRWRTRGVVSSVREVELLEPRTVLSVSAVFAANALTVTSTAADTIIVRANAGGQVEVRDQNDAEILVAAVIAADVHTLVVNGSASANVIDLSGVTKTLFTALPNIVVNGGDGADLITGSGDLADNLNGGDGNDTLNGGGGRDLLDGGGGDDLLRSGDEDGWHALGPAPVTGAQVQNVTPNNGEVSGAVQALAVHPTNPDIMYVGTVQGGVWRTNNATSVSPTWTPQTDFLPSLSIGDIQFDPTDPTGNTLVVGFARSSSLEATGGPETGMARTIDGGKTWTLINPAKLKGETILSVAVRDNVLMAASDNLFSESGGNGLFRSDDGGANFFNLSDGAANHLPVGSVSSLIGDPTNQSRFYAAVRQQGVFRSNTAGATWEKVNTGLNGIGTISTRILLAVHATTTSNAVYAFSINSSGAGSGLFRSADAGMTWTALDTPTVLSKQGSVHGAIVADPTNPNVVYVSGDAISTSPFTLNAVRVNGSLPFGTQSISIVGANAAATTATPTAPHADSRRLVFANGSLIAGTDGGIYRRSSPTLSTGVWTSLNSNLQTLEFHDIAFDPISKIIIGGAQDNATNFQTTIGSQTFTQTQSGDGGDVAVDALALPGQSIRYVSSQKLVSLQRQTFNSSNVMVGTAATLALTPATGSAALKKTRFVTPLTTNAVVGGRLLIADETSLYESLDRGDTVTEVGVGIRGNNGNAIVYGGRNGAVANENLITVAFGTLLRQRTTAGNSFATLASPSANPIEALTVNPNNSDELFAVDTDTQLRVFHSVNGGTSWTNVTGNLAATGDGNSNTGDVDVEFISGTSPSIAVGAHEGVFRMSLANLGVWSEMGGAALPNTAVWELVYNAANDILVAGTMGRGAWVFGNVSQGDQVLTPTNLIRSTLKGAGDTLIGGDGNDTLLGASGNDSLVGGIGDDLLNGGSGTNTVDGGGDMDTIAANGDFNFTLIASRVTGNGTSNFTNIEAAQLIGGAGNNSLNASNFVGRVTLAGGAGNDTLVGGTGKDSLQGDGGNDVLTGKGNDDTLDGGSGSDTVIESRSSTFTVTGSIANGTLTGAGSDVLTNIEGVKLTTANTNSSINAIAFSGSATLIGGNGNDTLMGGTGKDYLSSGGGDDSLTGNGGDDEIYGLAGKDTIDGGPGKDSVFAGDGNDSVNGGADDDTLDGGTGADTINGDDGADKIFGQAGNDRLKGGLGNDTIDGGAGNDTIIGGDDDDSITGGAGNDAINGSDGHDLINGGDGNDTLVGGAGNDCILGGNGNDTLLVGEGDDTVNGQAGADRVAGNPDTYDEVTVKAADKDVLDEAFTLSDALQADLEMI